MHSFGGNPAHIALFGESAGAASIVAHLVAPASRGLFNNGILQSGTLDNKWSLDSPTRALQKSEALAKRHNCFKEDVSNLSYEGSMKVPKHKHKVTYKSDKDSTLIH